MEENIKFLLESGYPQHVINEMDEFEIEDEVNTLLNKRDAIFGY